ncbi:hypothetical protein [Achromobacter sp. NFACC18-2]|uniref:hypothetical protein n=1 Tax=Achromobacter sp. NFACC18-2 TaxID=1564112 RepID=UPI0008B7B4F3|nr:hypothetical protein [Achromobacter sp. NFACC18-2]SEJ99784.1 hypothetical protein SAMN03159494_04236 [Achromobacter sp. NFACC18-2]
MKRSLLAASLLCTVSFAGQAQIIGHGVGVHDSCGSFLSAFKKAGPDRAIRLGNGETYPTMTNHYMAWVQGFVTATNMTRPDNGQIDTDREGLAGWIKNYCEKHPEQTLNMATIALVRALPIGFQ